MKFTPHPYQRRATEFALENRKCALWLDMGLGKTASTLLAVKRLVWSGETNKVLVVAPLRVARSTWPAEIAKWDDFNELTYTVLAGATQAQRLRRLDADVDIYLVNYELLKWLVNHYGKRWPFDTVVLDESSRMKSPSSHRFRAMRRALPYVRRLIELTGTPSPNGLLDLWSQAYLLDGGERLGKTFGAYKQRWFYAGDYYGYTLVPYSHAQRQIEKKLSDICMSMRAEDYLDLPELVSVTVPVDMGPRALKAYKALEDDMYAVLDTAEVEVFNTAALTNKCLQFANGAVYMTDEQDPEKRHTHLAHDAKLDALEELLEDVNEPVLVAYWYQSDLERLQARFPDGEVLGGDDALIERWNAKQVSLMFIHPGSAGHGLNLQAGGNVLVWFSMTWNLELYQQTNARLHRQGQEKPVIVHHLVCTGTLDEVVMERLASKAAVQDLLIERMRDMKEAA